LKYRKVVIVKKAVDPNKVNQFVDALSYLFTNRLSQGFASIQSYVMQFEVLKIEDISNQVMYNQAHGLSGFIQSGDRTINYDKSYNNQNNFSNNSLESNFIF